MPAGKPEGAWNSSILYIYVVCVLASKRDLSADLFKERESSQLEGNCYFPELLEEIRCQFILRCGAED